MMNEIYPNQDTEQPEKTAPEARQEDLEAMLSSMAQRIRVLEQIVHTDRGRQVEIPAEVWREGADHAAGGRVHQATEEREGDEQIRSGSVVCNFGFVHHPWVRLSRDDRGIRISGFRCDCQKFTENEFCGHCAALLDAERGDLQIVLLPDSAVQVGSQIRNLQSGIRDISVTERFENTRNQRVYRGKALCNFNFVHYPKLTVDALGNVVNSDCTCAGSAGSKLCIHGTALLPLVREQERQQAYAPVELLFREPEEESDVWEPEAESLIPVEENIPEAPAETEEQLPPEPGTNNMTIRFGTEVDTGEPILWFPNDTNQITHINMGIIGTMGTGKTQFTKSVITQLHRQHRNNPGGEDLGVLIFDYKGDYNEEKTDFIQATGARVLKLHQLPFNPFALRDFKTKPQLHVHTAMSFADTLTRVYGLGPIQKTTLVQAILAAYEENGIGQDPRSWTRPAPTFAQIHCKYSQGRNPRGDSLAAAMDTIAMFELFEPDPMKTVSLYEMLRGTVVIDMSGYPSELKNLAVAITLDLFYAQMLNSRHSHLVTTEYGGVYRQIRKVILVDEADNIMSSGLPVLKNIIKEGREFGVGMVLSTQFLDHFRSDDEDYRKYMKTWVVHNVENLKRSDVEYVFQLPASDPGTERLYQQIKQLEKHHSVIRIGNGAPRHTRDLPFYRIVELDQASYLPEPEVSGEAE